MARAGGAYVVRDDGAGREQGAGVQQGSVDQLFPYTLKGLTDALEEARFRSFAGPPQLVLVKADSGLKVIRRYEHGRETGAQHQPPALLPGGPGDGSGAGRRHSFWMIHRVINGGRTAPAGRPAAVSNATGQTTSNRSAFATLAQAATKS
jgi:hypothetical protein